MIEHLRKYSNAISCGVIAVASILAYLFGSAVSASIVGYIAAIPALAVILITAVARVNDIQPDKTSKRWQFRRAGLTIAAAAAAAMLLAPLYGAQIGWSTVALIWGFALTWLTTPEMPPWWRWISGRDEVPAGD